MGYHLNRLDEPVFIAVSKPLLTEFGIHHRLESCAKTRHTLGLKEFIGGQDSESVPDSKKSNFSLENSKIGTHDILKNGTEGNCSFVT